MTLTRALEAIVGTEGLVTEWDVLERYREDWSGERGCAPSLAVRPRTTSEVAAVMRECRNRGQRVVVQGGRTGVVGAAIPQPLEIVLTLERMNRVIEIDSDAGVALVEAGAVLQQVQEAVEGQGMCFPLDLGSRGSCTIGGNIATNAGGNRVLRFGMMRELVAGLEAVLADGTVIDVTRRMLKDNAGYDLRQMFIGSEGTLGVVTRAVLRLSPQPADSVVAFCAVCEYDAVLALWRAARGKLGAQLTAFEVMWPGFYERVAELRPGPRLPLPVQRVFHVLLEVQGDHGSASDALESLLSAAHSRVEIIDAAVSRAAADASALWSIRDSVAELYRGMLPAHSYDISLPLAALGSYVTHTLEQLAQEFPDHRAVTFAHLGDGNVHFLVNPSSKASDAKAKLDHIVYANLRALGGSISAEHGIGIVKRDWLGRARDEAQLALMQRIKHAVDPGNILGANRVFTACDRPQEHIS